MPLKLLLWLPQAVIITALSGLVYTAVQQNYRQSAYDPQVQMSEDAASELSEGKELSQVVPPTTVDLAKSLATYMIVFDNSGKIAGSSAILNGKTPTPPSGVVDYAKTYGQNRLTWQPDTDVRSAVVLTRYTGSNNGVVLVGRSLREVEERESKLTMQVGLVWAAALTLTFFLTLLIPLPRSKK